MLFLLYFLGDPEGDYFKAGKLFSILANLIKESSPLISGIFKFFSILINLFSSKLFLFGFLSFFLLILTIILIFYKQKRKKIKF